jgi:hypothetical protein
MRVVLQEKAVVLWTRAHRRRDMYFRGGTVLKNVLEQFCRAERYEAPALLMRMEEHETHRRREMPFRMYPREE